MSDSERKPLPISDPALNRNLRARVEQLHAERSLNQVKRVELDVRDRQIDRELWDCHAAARLFGINIDVAPKKVDLEEVEDELEVLLNSPGPSPAEKAAAVKTGIPRVSDIVLDQLRAAGTAGSKAAPIQEFIERTYRVKIHDKTVGMTLYRLLHKGLVRREGHIWFIATGAVNPGADTPGSFNRRI